MRMKAWFKWTRERLRGQKLEAASTDNSSKELCWASLVAQWLRIRLPMQGMQVRALVREDPTCHGATKPVRHNYWACALEPVSHNYWARERQLLRPHATTTEAHALRDRAPQQEKPPQREARTPQGRVTPTRCNQRKPTRSNEDPTQPKINK